MFRDIHQRHHWTGSASASGAGAAEEQTARLRTALPALLAERRQDAPRPALRRLQLDGDGGPAARAVHRRRSPPQLIAPLQQRYGDSSRRFMVLDLTRDPLPPSDLVLCRDCLVHLSHADIRRALRNILRSGVPYLLTTTFPDGAENEDIVTGDWRVLDLQRPPFSFRLRSACS